jgi:Mn2+/Fe2+ NRAMP family transporter
MKRILELSLGVVTGIGGFLEIGSIATAAQGGAAFRFELGWAIVLGTICLIFLIEMSGRLAAMSRHTVMDAIREHFGFPFTLIPVVAIVIVSLLVMASEVGGVCLALQLVTGLSPRLFGLPVALVIWLLLWRGTFGVVEQGTSLLGLVTLVFLVGAIHAHPDWRAVAHGLVPSLPSHEKPQYWFIAAAILGASITPYLFLFYSSGAVEDEWDSGYIGTNRITSVFGMSFGGVLSVAVLVVTATVCYARGIRIDSFDQIAVVLPHVLGRWGFYLFAASLGISCLGASAEIALCTAYILAQTFGWNWSENERPRNAARFSITYTIAIALAAIPMLLGLDPLKLTVLSMALTAATLPAAIVPFLVIMNDEHYLDTQTNGWFGNVAVTMILLLSFVLAVVSIPLQILGG